MKCLILKILANFCLLDLVIDFFPGWSDSVSLRFHLDDLDLRCVLDSLGRLGPLLSWSVILKIFGLFHLRLVHGWLDMCVHNLFNDSLLDPVLRQSLHRYCVFSTC